MAMRGLAGRVAVVTGAAGGIGAAVEKVLATAGEISERLAVAAA